MIEVTSFLLKHLYEFMADNYALEAPSVAGANCVRRLLGCLSRAQAEPPPPPRRCRRSSAGADDQHQCSSESQNEAGQQDGNATLTSGQQRQLNESEREQETNQQIVTFLIYNQLPDLACETFIELLSICVFLAISWILVMIVQLHSHPLQMEQQTKQQFHSARQVYCQTRLVNSLMYCNNKQARQVAF